MTALTTSKELVAALIAKGVTFLHPEGVYIGPEVNVDRISGDGVVIHPGCRIRGANTVISAGCVLGAEGPVTIENCQLGPKVVLKGGYFSGSVFLEKANMGLAAHVREGTLLEEEAGGAHCVGLKQTILFPFVTLGSLINFCDCLMAGGTSRSDHSEVGSSYIHFNFTPDGNKTTASLFGDVARGVMLDQPAIFLGGQGGAVGPIMTGYGTVVAAGSVLRSDVPEDGMLVIADAPRGRMRPSPRHTYRGLRRLLEKNLTYIANLDALEAWYREIRRPFFAQQELGLDVYEGALAALASGRAERIKRIKALATKVGDSDEERRHFVERVDAMMDIYGGSYAPAPAALVDQLTSQAVSGQPYVSAVQGLPTEARALGVSWLDGLIQDRHTQVAASAPGLKLFAA